MVTPGSCTTTMPARGFCHYVFMHRYGWAGSCMKGGKISRIERSDPGRSDLIVVSPDSPGLTINGGIEYVFNPV